jgi:hypothetical protein
MLLSSTITYKFPYTANGIIKQTRI